MSRVHLFISSSLAFISGSLSTYLVVNQSYRQKTQPQKLLLPDTVDSGPSLALIRSRYSLPGEGERVSVYENYVLSYDRRSRTAKWVFEHLTPQQLVGNSTNGHPSVNRNNFEFHLDQDEDPLFCATNIDYRGSGFDRGHLAAAGNYQVNPTHCHNTFVLSNIAPQVGRGFNRDVWNNLEKHVRAIVRDNRNVYVCTGPLYLPSVREDGKAYVNYQVIGPNNVAVPTHFFKVIVVETHTGQFELLSYVLPNAPLSSTIRLDAFLVPITFVEKSAGFRIFPDLSLSSFSSVNKGKTATM